MQQNVKKSVSDMSICQVSHHDYVNPCGQALDKRVGGSQSPQLELHTIVQILHHPFYRQSSHGFIRVSNIITTATVYSVCAFFKFIY